MIEQDSGPVTQNANTDVTHGVDGDIAVRSRN